MPLSTATVAHTESLSTGQVAHMESLATPHRCAARADGGSSGVFGLRGGCFADTCIFGCDLARGARVCRCMQTRAQAATTMAGCTCANPWEYDGSLFRGTCGNPDDDPLGEWCVVADASTCTLGAPVGNNFDYCAAPEAGTGVAVEVPTELVGDWEGNETHVGGTCELRMSTVAASTMLSMRCVDR